jgi:hypothetical protein
MLLVGSVAVAHLATHIYRRPAPDAGRAEKSAQAGQASWADAEIPAADAAMLRAWIFTPRTPNGGAVILLHGVNASRTGVLGHARYLLAAGYTVLTPDSRGHGVSGGDFITYGIKEAADVHAWADWLFRNRPVARLYGMGESMGAGIILESLATEPRLRAVVAQCPFATFEEVAYDRLNSRTGIPEPLLWPVIQLGYIYGRATLGVDLRQASPLEAVRQTHVPVLLIHGMADRNIPYRHSQELHAANPAATTLWLVPGASHFNTLSRDPELYARTVVDWFEGHH